MAIVGTAIIRVKLLSNKVGDDIKNAVQGSLNNIRNDVTRSSEDLGNDVGNGIGDGIRDSDAVRNAGDTVTENVTRNVNKGFKRNRKQIMGAFKSWLVGGILSAGPGIIAGGLQILSALGASLIALGSTLGAAFAGAAIAGLGAFVALKSTMFLINLALKTTTPALATLKKDFKELKEEVAGSVQVGLLPGLARSTNNLRKALPALRKQLMLTGKTVGDLADDFTKALTTGRNLGLINKILANNNKFISLAGQGLTKMAEAALIFLSHLGPITDFLGQLIKDAGAWLLVTTQTADANGTLATKIAEWFSLARRAFGVMADFGIGIFNIFKNARTTGDILFAGIETAARNFREWTSSVSGENSIKQFFADALPLAQETWGLLGDILRLLGGVSFGDNAGALEFVRTIRTSLLPGLTELFDTIRENTGDDWGEAFRNISQAIQDLAKSGVLGATAKAISAIAVAISTIVSLPLAPTVLGWTAAFFLFNKMLFGLPGMFLNFITRPLQTALSRAATSALTAGKNIAINLLKGLGSAFVEIGKTALAFAKDFGKIFLRALGQQFLRLGPLLLNAIRAAIPAIISVLASIPVVGWIILAVAAVIAILVLLYVKVKGFRDKVNAIWESIVNFFKAAWETISTAFQTAITFITGVISTVSGIFRAALAPVITVVQVIVSIIMKIFEIGFKVIEIIVKVLAALITIAFKAIAGVVIPIVKGIWDSIVGAFNAIQAIITAVVQGIWNTMVTVFNAIYNYIRGVVNRVWTTIRTVFLLIWAAVRGPVTQISNFVRSVFGGIASFVSSVWSRITGAISTAVSKAYNTVVTWFNRIKSFVGGVVESIRAIASGVWTGIASGLTSILNKVIGGVNVLINGINGAIGIANKLPGVNISRIDPLPMMAAGGVVTATPGGVPAILAEGGRSERVEPLDKDGLSKRDREIIKALSTATGSGGATTVNVYIGQEKLDAIIDTKIEESNENLAQQIVTGRR